jgi:hypothetical protein
MTKLKIQVAIVVLSRFPWSIDRLPYSSRFHEVHELFCQLAKAKLSQNEVWLALLYVRKRGLAPARPLASQLPRESSKNRETECKDTMRKLEVATRVLEELPMPLDRVPYTPAFEKAYARFCQYYGASVPRDEVWWSLLTARKRGRKNWNLRGPRSKHLSHQA